MYNNAYLYMRDKRPRVEITAPPNTSASLSLLDSKELINTVDYRFTRSKTFLPDVYTESTDSSSPTHSLDININCRPKVTVNPCQFQKNKDTIIPVYNVSTRSINNSYFENSKVLHRRKAVIGVNILESNKVKFDQTSTSFSKNESSTDRCIKYELSNKRFINNGWTKVKFGFMQRIQVYSSNPVMCVDWLTTVRPPNSREYDTGTAFITKEPGLTRTFYKSKRLALQFTAKDKRFNGADIYIVYSDDKHSNILALFDVVGNGIVYDEHQQIRFVYNQHEIEIVDSRIGNPGRIGWHGNRLTRVLREMFTGQKLLKNDPEFDDLLRSIISRTSTPLAPKAVTRILGAEKSISPSISVSKTSTGKPVAAKIAKTSYIQLDPINEKILLEEPVPTDNLWNRPVIVGLKAHHVKINSNFALIISGSDNITLKFWDKKFMFKIQLGFTLDRTKSDSLYVNPNIVTCAFNRSPPANREYYAMGQLVDRKRKESMKRDLITKRLRGVY